MKNPERAGRMYPRQFFSVSENVKYLESAQLEALEQAFIQWRDAAKRADSVRARLRLWLIFMLLRHSGARLGEVLALDDRAAFSSVANTVRLGDGERSREVPLSDAVYAEVVRTLESPAGCGLRGDFFHVDPGYFRRICYARGRECGLSRDMVGPTVLRNTRAVEMLRSGVPITVVKEMLGQSSLDLTAPFQRFTPQDAASIMQKSLRGRTSARNAFTGHVVDIRTDAVMAQVVLETRSGLRLCAVITVDSLENLDLRVGSPVEATVKAPLVNVLSCDEHPGGSACNRLRAKVVRVTDSPVLTEVLARLPDGTDVCALISAESAGAMDLATGTEAQFWFKALSVVLNTG